MSVNPVHHFCVVGHLMCVCACVCLYMCRDVQGFPQGDKYSGGGGGGIITYRQAHKGAQCPGTPL